MKRYRVEFTETKSYEAFVEDEELIEKDVIIDEMYLQSKSS
ncbi:hypothetical protein QRE63_18845 [Bacillus mycoides]|nr:hypothetical protein [Bacillus mycoides]WJE62702.1 hypothetical protein QRE63_18845 [Bacillus mycoides]